MSRRTELIMRVNKEAGSEAFYQAAQKLGTLAALSFQEEQGKERRNRHRAQMTGLENVTETTLKVTDVLDYIKKQTARQKGWQVVVGQEKESFGKSLKEYIESGLEPFLKRVCDDFIMDTNDDGRQERRNAYLELVRQFIRQLVVQYEYRVTFPEESTRE